MKPRPKIPVKTKAAIRSRAGDRCEDCGVPLQAIRETEYPERWTDRMVLDIRVDYPCYRCGFRFPAVGPSLLALALQVLRGELRESEAIEIVRRQPMGPESHISLATGDESKSKTPSQ
jgi:hypothetical protein